MLPPTAEHAQGAGTEPNPFLLHFFLYQAALPGDATSASLKLFQNSAAVCFFLLS